MGRGALTDARRRQLDDLMVAGAYVATEDGPWTNPDTPLVLGAHRAVVHGESLRVEHDGVQIYERTEHHIPKYSPVCKLRALPVGTAGIILESSCSVLDEGVEVIEFNVSFCDEKQC